MAYNSKTAQRATISQLEFALNDINDSLRQGFADPNYLRKLNREKDVVVCELAKRRRDPAKDFYNAIGVAYQNAVEAGLDEETIQEVLLRHVGIEEQSEPYKANGSTI